MRHYALAILLSALSLVLSQLKQRRWKLRPNTPPRSERHSLTKCRRNVAARFYVVSAAVVAKERCQALRVLARLAVDTTHYGAQLPSDAFDATIALIETVSVRDTAPALRRRARRYLRFLLRHAATNPTYYSNLAVVRCQPAPASLSSCRFPSDHPYKAGTCPYCGTDNDDCRGSSNARPCTHLLAVAGYWEASWRCAALSHPALPIALPWRIGQELFAFSPKVQFQPLAYQGDSYDRSAATIIARLAECEGDRLRFVARGTLTHAWIIAACEAGGLELERRDAQFDYQEVFYTPDAVAFDNALSHIGCVVHELLDNIAIGTKTLGRGSS